MKFSSGCQTSSAEFRKEMYCGTLRAHFVNPLHSETVSPALSAKKNLTPSASVDELRHSIVAHVALVASPHTLEPIVFAVVIGMQLVRHVHDISQIGRSNDTICSVSGQDGFIGTLVESVLVPLRASAFLPGMGATAIAELHLADTARAESAFHGH